MSRIASRAFPSIRARAFSWRAWRSSLLMGCAWSFIDFKPAIAGGNTAAVALGFWAELLFTNKALAATEPAWRKARRVDMVVPDYRTWIWRRKALRKAFPRLSETFVPFGLGAAAKQG